MIKETEYYGHPNPFRSLNPDVKQSEVMLAKMKAYDMGFQAALFFGAPEILGCRVEISELQPEISNQDTEISTPPTEISDTNTEISHPDTPDSPPCNNCLNCKCDG
jgi:hypothetical protein